MYPLKNARFLCEIQGKFNILDFIAIQICAVLIHLHIYSCSRSLHYHTEMCCTATLYFRYCYQGPLHYHVEMCCTATLRELQMFTSLLHYHVEMCCTATSNNGITDYYRILTTPRMKKV